MDFSSTLLRLSLLGSAGERGACAPLSKDAVVSSLAKPELQINIARNLPTAHERKLFRIFFEAALSLSTERAYASLSCMRAHAIL